MLEKFQNSLEKKLTRREFESFEHGNFVEKLKHVDELLKLKNKFFDQYEWPEIKSAYETALSVMPEENKEAQELLIEFKQHYTNSMRFLESKVVG